MAEEKRFIANGLDIKDIDSLAKVLNENNLERIKIKGDNNFEICIEARKTQIIASDTAKAVSAPVSVTTPEATTQTAVSPKGNVVKAPIVGTFYSSPSPDAEDFVKVGQSVKVGDVLFIIESMKVMNEVKSEFDGVVQVINIKNSQTVEYDEPIMVIG